MNNTNPLYYLEEAGPITTSVIKNGLNVAKKSAEGMANRQSLAKAARNMRAFNNRDMSFVKRGLKASNGAYMSGIAPSSRDLQNGQRLIQMGAKGRNRQIAADATEYLAMKKGL